ncbi:MAG: hypothetical protein NUV46_03505 [Nanoarchaeota archaeon]|nr:hypothetical protein [Nanoarchaeota archaeon]
MKHLGKLISGGLIVLSPVIPSCTGSRYNPGKEDILDKRELKITLEELKKTNEEFYRLENEFYEALTTETKNNLNFDSLQAKYSSLKAEREKYQKLLEINTEYKK